MKKATIKFNFFPRVGISPIVTINFEEQDGVKFSIKTQFKMDFKIENNYTRRVDFHPKTTKIFKEPVTGKRKTITLTMGNEEVLQLIREELLKYSKDELTEMIIRDLKKELLKSTIDYALRELKYDELSGRQEFLNDNKDKIDFDFNF